MIHYSWPDLQVYIVSEIRSFKNESIQFHVPKMYKSVANHFPEKLYINYVTCWCVGTNNRLVDLIEEKGKLWKKIKQLQV